MNPGSAEKAFRRAVVRLFVRRGWLAADHAQGILQWPHSGFHVHAGGGVPADDRAFALRVARYCARSPVALGRLAYDAEEEVVTYRSDKTHGPTAGTETVDPLEFLARVVTRFPFFNLMNLEDLSASLTLRPGNQATARTDIRRLRLSGRSRWLVPRRRRLGQG